jgi:SAM-dependent methyltransferase
MRRGTVQFDSRGQFAGHETFPLRLLWLKKAFDAVGEHTDARTFQEQEAIARFGVGRNMAASMRYWALATGFFNELDRVITPTPLGRAILADNGLDPYLEQAATIWLAHWRVASTPDMTTTAYYAFNHLSAIEFDPAMLVEELFAVVADNGWRATRGTLKRDIEVFLRSYVRRGDSLNEDAAEPLLAELDHPRGAAWGMV